MYFGGKNGNGTKQIIINFIPPHQHYIELFLGSGAILAAKKPAPGQNIGIEICQDTIDKFRNRFPKGTRIIKNDAIAWLTLKNYFNDDPGTFIYIDPPYPISSRKQKKKVYRHELTDQDHIDLLKVITRSRSMIAISTYPNEIYKKYLKGWTKVTFQSKTQKGNATEVLYMNYPIPKVLHDFSFVGTNFTERQRIKRRIKNQIRILSTMNILERNAIFTALRTAGIIE